MERWDLDARASYNLRPYVGIRTPMVEPLGEAKDVRWIFPEIAKRIGGGMEDWYQESEARIYGTMGIHCAFESRDWEVRIGAVAGRRMLGEYGD